jgi:hypothetical protein
VHGESKERDGESSEMERRDGLITVSQYHRRTCSVVKRSFSIGPVPVPDVSLGPNPGEEPTRRMAVFGSSGPGRSPQAEPRDDGNVFDRQLIPRCEMHFLIRQRQAAGWRGRSLDFGLTFHTIRSPTRTRRRRGGNKHDLLKRSRSTGATTEDGRSRGSCERTTGGW